MKKSEIIKAEIDRLESEYEERVRAEVFETSEPRETPEQHEALWKRFWESYGCDNVIRKEELEEQLSKELNREIEVGDGVTICLWSDMEACTVIARTKCTLTVQRDKATRDPNWKPSWEPGGFSAICTNNDDQKWLLERDPNGRVERCYWSEKYGRWQTGGDGSIHVIRGRHEHYDYNF